METSEVHQGWLQRKFHFYLASRPDTEKVILWWERRRPAYNVLLFLWTFLNIVLATIVSLTRSKQEWAAAGGLILVIGVIIQITANIWYTGGWIVEWLIQALIKVQLHSFGRWALLAGTLFSFVFAEYWYWTIILETMMESTR